MVVSFLSAHFLSMCTASRSETRFTSNTRLYLQRRKEEKENGGQDMTDYNEQKDTVVSFAET